MIRPDQWHPSDGMVLEPNAWSAVTMESGNVIVTAGPGAGKTELLAQRADFLLRTGLCRYPRRILAVSFKVDAARNLRDRVRRRSGAALAARFDSFTFHAFAKRLIDSYRPALTGYNALEPDYQIHPTVRIEGTQITYNDLLPLALEILESNSYALGAIRQTYGHVFLDEFQDCTDHQYQLINAAFRGGSAVVTAVGDAKQQIMAWAGALDGVSKTFADEFSAESLPLYQNFRSAPRLRRMQNRMVAQMDPAAVSPDADLVGEEGRIEVFTYADEYEEATAIATLIEEWIHAGVMPHDIAVLVRQKPEQVAADLGQTLTSRNIAYRDENKRQELSAEPAAALILAYIGVIAEDRRPDAYTELMRIATRGEAAEDAALFFDSQLKRLIYSARATARGNEFHAEDPREWRTLVEELLHRLGQPALSALSLSYQQGTRLADVVEATLEAFEQELAVDGDPIRALRRLSELDAVPILTIHKCKGLEFEKVVVLGVEQDFFFGTSAATMSEFFVAISRAKQHLVLTNVRHRRRPAGAHPNWRTARTPARRFLEFAREPEATRPPMGSVGPSFSAVHGRVSATGPPTDGS
ncbi:UvrD-helicase domain-containing protein [Nocardia grenadensis]|uniref:UvrD-helicase domain-containing protein n=1 Tax=Nocardia grenadensis TaxID=931537 RepID=UPI003D8F3DDF